MEYTDFPMFDKFDAVGGAIVLILSYIFGDHWQLFAAYLALNFLDYMTGMAKSRILSSINSRVGLHGIVKKFMNWVMIAIGFGFAPLLNTLGDVIGADISFFSPLIGYYLLSTLIVNEATSILENLIQMGVEVPDFFVKLLSAAGKTLVAPGEALSKALDGKLVVNSEKNANTYEVHLDIPLEDLTGQDTVTLKIDTVGKSADEHKDDERK